MSAAAPVPVPEAEPVPEPAPLPEPVPVPELVPDDVVDALRRVLAPLGVPERVEPLTGGMFATTYRVTLADGTRVVVKTAPTDTSRLLTYERDLIRSEALVYRLAEVHPGLLMPRVLLTDFSREVLAGDVVVASHLPGTPWLEAGFGPPDDDPRAARTQRELGALMARLHRVTGPTFGYVLPGSALRASTWPAAFTLMVEALLDDAARWGTPVPADEVRAALRRHAAALALVHTPALVHADLWPGNVFVEAATGAVLGVIDPERAFWGDPLFEVVGNDQLGLGPVPAALLAGYREAGGHLDPAAPDEAARLALYRLYMSLVLVVEIAPRGYVGDWLPAHRSTAEANLRAVLARMA